MPGWGFWEWVGYATLGIAAVMLAFDTAMKNSSTIGSKTMRLRGSPVWGFAPLILLLIAGGIIVANQLGWTAHKVAPSAPMTPASGDAKVAIGLGSEIRGPFSVTNENGKVIFSVPAGQVITSTP